MVTEPESMEELVYMTNRELDNEGYVKAWVYRKECPKCKKAKMGKPKNEKTGRAKIRATEYVCPECGYTEEKVEYEESLTCEIKYQCPSCKNEAEAEVQFKRKRIGLINKDTGKKKMADAIQFECSKCKEKINITKKMKS